MSETLIGQIITGVVTLGVALFGYLRIKASQQKIEEKVDTYHKEVNGMKSELITAVAGQNVAEGQLKGLQQAKDDSITAKAVVVEAARVLAETPTAVQEVKIVEQAKPIDVKIEKEKE